MGHRTKMGQTPSSFLETTTVILHTISQATANQSIASLATTNQAIIHVEGKGDLPKMQIPGLSVQATVVEAPTQVAIIITITTTTTTATTTTVAADVHQRQFGEMEEQKETVERLTMEKVPGVILQAGIKVVETIIHQNSIHTILGHIKLVEMDMERNKLSI